MITEYAIIFYYKWFHRKAIWWINTLTTSHVLFSDRQCINKSSRSRSNSSGSSIVLERKAARVARRHRADSTSSIGDTESVATFSSFGAFDQDLQQQEDGDVEVDFTADSQDIVATSLTNKPLTELLRVSRRKKLAKVTETAPPPLPSVSCYEITITPVFI